MLLDCKLLLITLPPQLDSLLIYLMNKEFIDSILSPLMGAPSICNEFG